VPCSRSRAGRHARLCALTCRGVWQDICQALQEARRDANEQQVLVTLRVQAVWRVTRAERCNPPANHVYLTTGVAEQVFEILEKLGLADGSSRVRFHE
jgi:hypothetical protein